MPLVTGVGRGYGREGPKNADVQSLFSPEAAVWYMDQRIVLESTSKSAIYLLKNLGKLFNHSEHQFFKCRKMKTLISSNDYYDDSMWWLVKKIPVARFLILKMQSVTYYTGKIAWQRRSVILESLFQQFHQTLAISVATTYTTCGITHKRKFLGQVTLRDFLTASLREKPLGESLFFIKRLEMGAHH